MDLISGILNQLQALAKRISNLEAHGAPRWVYLATPLTSTDWTLDTFSTTAKTKIDLSTVFGVPAGVKAVDVLVNLRDAASVANYCYLILSPNDTADSGKPFKADRGVDDELSPQSGVIPCDSAGDIFYQVVASGAGTMDITLQIHGYLR